MAGSDADAGGVVIAPPHPLYGGSMDSPVVVGDRLGVHARGLASLRFNWRGVGASGGIASGDAEDARADYAAALAQLASTRAGAACSPPATRSAPPPRCASPPTQPRVRGLMLVAPPPVAARSRRARRAPARRVDPHRRARRDRTAPPRSKPSRASCRARASCRSTRPITSSAPASPTSAERSRNGSDPRPTPAPDPCWRGPSGPGAAHELPEGGCGSGCRRPGDR